MSRRKHAYDPKIPRHGHNRSERLLFARPKTDNETTQMWREVRDEGKMIREKLELRQERQLAIAVKLGQLDARALSEYHWRVWHPSRPKVTLDFWPRSAKGRDIKRNETFHATVAILISRLRP